MASSSVSTSSNNATNGPEGMSVPFRREHQLNDELMLNDGGDDSQQHLPGHPRIALSNTQLLVSFLEAELCSQDLEKMAPYLWMMSLQSSANISPLHRQIVKGREIIITEDPTLHLVWLPNRIHIKPLPTYLLSYTFWDHYLLRPTSPLPPGPRALILKAALGYLRTYSHLIRHESDFFLAQERHLLPSSTSWPQFSAFAATLSTRIPDTAVAQRYTYGELRLTRLNVYGKFVLRRAHLFRLPPLTTYGLYFARFHAPFLFVFALLSLTLNALQVGLAVEPLAQNKWPAVRTLGRALMLPVLAFSLAAVVMLAVLFAVRFWREWRYALGEELGRRRARRARRAGEKEGGAGEIV